MNENEVRLKIESVSQYWHIISNGQCVCAYSSNHILIMIYDYKLFATDQHKANKQVLSDLYFDS